MTMTYYRISPLIHFLRYGIKRVFNLKGIQIHSITINIEPSLHITTMKSVS